MAKLSSPERIIIALDFATLAEASQAVDCLPQAKMFKVGLQAFLQYGEAVIAHLQQRQKQLFLDLKFHDIPNTVAGAVNSSRRHFPRFLTLHLSGGREMIRQAVAAASAAPALTLLGVTVLTSLADEDLLEMGMDGGTETAVLRLCELGFAAGLRAFVCSPREIVPIRQRFGPDITLVVPGIRPEWSTKDDQKRIFTPKAAIAAGADYLVIGRPITQHPNPAAAWQMVMAEID